ncbi:GGDEF domain-containing protein [Marinomonas rhizomae]|uniref:diguanylate cyclase n=1 Tax=Marinomonas rhizomae TaxID=491948 RepID=A0A366JG42_9GAMM|nr:diguanylate cyclase [Marinomonas rhizomae]RBP85275.1 diguanylate cyclase [Marinomonas rhizomae]RNF76371.1 GGDEF domain-containing protein [Marinomonas rhizomae]
MINSYSQLFIRICLLFVTWGFSSVANATIPTQVIQGSSIKLEQFQMGYFVDKTETMPVSEVQKQEFQLSPNGVSLGTTSKMTWAKIEIENANTTPVKIYLHHPYAYHNHKVELYEIMNGELTRERILDMDRKETQQWMYRGSAVFDITLAPHQHKTLLVKSQSFSHQWFTLNLYDEDQSKRALLGLYTDIALLTGMLLALMIYNFLLFFSSRLREHFFYACYLVAGGFWIALSYGLLADLFNVFGSITLKWHLSLVAMPIFLLLFMINIFETKKKYPIEHWALLSILTLLICDFVYGLFDMITALNYSSTLAAIMMVISISVTISMLIRKHPIAPFFLLGHGLFVVFSTIAVLFYKGKAEFTYVNSHGVGIGIMLEALVLSLIIAYRIRKLEAIKASQDELKLLASTDSLTQLFNRRHFNTEAEYLLQQAKQLQQPAAIAMFDIDHFKQINDTYGHGFGDKVIVQVANTLMEECREQDILARYGGEEFIILMTNTSTNEALNLVEWVRQTLEKKAIEVNNLHTVHFTVSVGIAAVDIENPDLKNSINQADKALYLAKENGRNQSQVYEA